MKLKGRKIAILVENGFEQIELTSPKKALEEEGADVDIISPQEKKVRSWEKSNWGKDFDVDVNIDQANPNDYTGLVLPGGVMNPDKLRMNEKAVTFVKSFFENGKPICAICHAPWTLIETGALQGRELTSYPSLKTDLKNAGARWIDKEVVMDQGLVTSRRPDDLEAFNKKMLEEFGEGVHVKQ